jgi:hypothetical protein
LLPSRAAFHRPCLAQARTPYQCRSIDLPEAHEGSDALPPEHSAPAVERARHAELGAVVPDLVELLLKHVGDLEAAIEAEQLVELGVDVALDQPPASATRGQSHATSTWSVATGTPSSG